MRTRFVAAVVLVAALLVAGRWWLRGQEAAPAEPGVEVASADGAESAAPPPPPARADRPAADGQAEDATTPAFGVLVRTLEGAPVRGASVRADLLEPPQDPWGQDGYTPAETPVSVVPPVPTGADGRAVLRGAGTGRWRVVVEAAGYARREVATVRRAGDALRPVVIELEAAHALDVVVRDGEGRAAPGIGVRAVAWRTRFGAAGWPLIWRATTDASGSCRIERLPAGNVSVTCSEGERAEWTFARVPEVSRVDLVAPPTAVERQKATATLEVRAVDPYGSAVPGAAVRFAYGEDPFASTTAEGITGDDGVCRAVAVADAMACVEHVEVRKQGCATARAGMHLVQVGAGEVHRFDNIVLSPEARISGKVIGPEGPVARAKLTVWVATDDTFGRMAPERTVSADDGSWRVAGLAAGTVVVDADAPGLDVAGSDRYGSVTGSFGPRTDELDSIPASAKAVLTAGSETTHDVRMIRTGPATTIRVTYSGVVCRGDGTPVAWADVWAAGSTDHWHVPNAGRAIAGADGRFTLVAEAAEGFTLYASAPGLRSEEGVEVPAKESGTRDGVEIVLQALPVVRGTVRSTIGRPVAGARVRFGTHHSFKFAEGVVWDEVPEGLVAEDGTFALPVDVSPRGGDDHDSPCDEWALCVEADGHGPAISQAFTPEDLAAGRTLDVAVGAGATIAGRVVDGAGSPVADAPIRLVDDGGSINDENWPPKYPPGRGDVLAARTAADGSFRIERLLPSTYTVATIAAGCVPEELRVVAPAPSVEIRMRARLAVAGVVLTPDGAPLALASVELAGPHERGDGRFPGTTGEDGRFRFEGVPAGRWRLTVEPDADGPDVQPLVTEVEAGVMSLAIRTKPALALRGTLLDADGKPRAAMSVYVRRMDDAPDPWSEATTDAEGRFVRTHLAPGRFRVWFDEPTITFEGLEPGGMTVLRVPGKESISGTIRDRGGNPSPHLGIYARRIDTPKGLPVAVHEGTVAKDGTFEIRDLAAGRYALTVCGTVSSARTCQEWVADPGSEASAPSAGVILEIELHDVRR